MPYTPPSHQSPASSRTTSPVISRAPSFGADSPSVRSPQSSRPSLPRSVSSATYLNKHRRGPSFNQPEATGLPQSPAEDISPAGILHSTADSNGSIRQSPSPVSNQLIPTGAILSPPDSSENSDGDDTASSQRGRKLVHSWGELQQAVRSIELRRESSPARKDTSSSEPTTTIHSPTSLSAAARKIVHSRSSTENAIVIPDRITFSESTSSGSEDDDDDELRIKPPLVRKKSGELVKPALRPSSRRRYSSMPGTPTYHKSVHFNDNGNQTRHFLQVDKPSAVSAGSSPVETYESEVEYPFENKDSNKVEWTIRLANFPEDTWDRKTWPVRVDRLHLSSDSKTLVGTVAVANISFQKSVAARFTLDYWKTTSEVSADFDHDVRRQNPTDGCDRFSFSIRLSDQANLENKTLLLCIRYNSGGQEYWDNNCGINYQIDFVKKLAKSASTSSLALPGSRPRNSIPRSRHSPPATRRETSSSAVEDSISTTTAYHFGSPEKLIGDSQTSVKLKPRSKRADLLRAGSAPGTNGLGGRYDFGASLSAALSNAQDKLGKSSGLLPHSQMIPRSDAHYFSQETASEAQATIVDERPDAITTDRPAIGSEQYRDLVKKFCYFTPGSSGKISPQTNFHGSKPNNNDGSGENESPPEYSPRSGSTTPTPPQIMSPFLDGASDRLGGPSIISSISSRSDSPASLASSSYASRTASPLAYGYTYRQKDGYFSESPTPTAIRG